MSDVCEDGNGSNGRRKRQGYIDIDATTLQCLSSGRSLKDGFPLARLFKYDVWLIRWMFHLILQHEWRLEEPS